MGILDVMQKAAGRTWVDEDGNEEVVRAQGPVSPARMTEIERALGFPLPSELEQVLRTSAGLDMLESLDLASIGPCPLGTLLGMVITLADDGAGNYWVLELRPGLETLGPVWFLCHDAPVLVYQSPDLATFIDDYLRFCAPPNDGPVAEVVRHAVRRVWAQTSDVTSSSLRDSPDPVLREFARRLGEGWFVADLRHARPGEGVPWGRFGPRTPLARAGDAFVFAYGSRTVRQRVWTWITGR